MWMCIIHLIGLTAKIVYGCEKNFSSDCQEVRDMGFTESGVYNITPLGTHGDTNVYCDMETDGGGWLVFQRRKDGSVSFHRDWTEYRDGFGNPAGEFWLGNRALHAILLQGHYELRIDLTDWGNDTAYAKYEYFKMGDTLETYKIILAEYSGNAGDSLKYTSGIPFTASDKGGSTCRLVTTGAWWYNECFDVDLNGRYLPKGSHISTKEGIKWNTWKGQQYSLQRTEMKLRRNLGQIL